MPQTPQLNGLTAVGASTAIEIEKGKDKHFFEGWFTHNAIEANKVSAVTIIVQGSLLDNGANGIINTTGPVLAIGSTAENVANSAFDYRIADVNYSKIAVPVGSSFTSAHVVTASKFGVINLYINAAGDITTLSTQLGQDQTVTLASDDAAAAITISEAIPTPANHIFIGYVLINADGGGWTAITDDMTDASDLTTATFISARPRFADLESFSFNANELVQTQKSFTLSNSWFRYMRMYLSTLTGTGKVYGQHIPGKSWGSR